MSNGKLVDNLDIKGEYTFEKAHAGEPYNTFIDGYYGIFSLQDVLLTNTDYYGYAGTLIYITHDQHYAAFDLCCPHCIKREPCYVDGFYVICPICGEKYDVSHGFGTPTLSISKQALRKYSAIYTNHRLTIRD